MLLFFENFFISLSAVFVNKTRSILTALGIIIGVFSVTMMGTLISGLDKTFESSMSMLGRDILYISRYEWFGDMEWWEVRNRPRMRTEYVEKVKKRSKYALAVDSNTSGQDLVLKALGIKDCDVISPTISFMTTAIVPVWNNCTSTIVDVMPDDLNIDPEDVKKNLKSNTKLVTAVNYSGVLAPVERIREFYDGFILEDLSLIHI